MALEDLLAQNRAWAAAQVARDPEFFSRHVAGQHPRVLWIGCADSRVPAEAILGCGPGELFIHRNVANLVAPSDPNIAAVIQYATAHLKIPDIVVCGHYGCGGVAAACADDLIEGDIGDWILNAGWARRAVDDQLAREQRALPREAYLQMVVQENVRLQVRHLSRLTAIRQCWQATPGVPRLHGWVYDIATGHVTNLVDNVTSPEWRQS